MRSALSGHRTPLPASRPDAYVTVLFKRDPSAPPRKMSPRALAFLNPQKNVFCSPTPMSKPSPARLQYPPFGRISLYLRWTGKTGRKKGRVTEPKSVLFTRLTSLGISPRGRSRESRHFFLLSPPSLAFPASGRGSASVSLFLIFSPFPFLFFFFFSFSPFLPFTISPRRCIPRAGAEPVSHPASPRPPPPYGEREPPPHPGTSGGGWRSGTGGGGLRSRVVMELIR